MLAEILIRIRHSQKDNDQLPDHVIDEETLRFMFSSFPSSEFFPEDINEDKWKGVTMKALPTSFNKATYTTVKKAGPTKVPKLAASKTISKQSTTAAKATAKYWKAFEAHLTEDAVEETQEEEVEDQEEKSEEPDEEPDEEPEKPAPKKPKKIVKRKTKTRGY